MKKQEFKYYIVISIISVLSIFVFRNDLRKIYFYQLNFDQDKAKVIKDLGNFNLKINAFMELSLSGNVLTNNEFNASKQYMFKFKDDKEKYYFSFLSKEDSLDRFEVHNVVWHLGYPTKKNGAIELFEVKLPFKDFPNKNKLLYISTKEDCRTLEGGMIRFLWDKAYGDVRFVGNKSDVSAYSFFEVSEPINQVEQYIETSKILISILNTNLSEDDYINLLTYTVNQIATYDPDKTIYIVTPIFRKENKRFELLLNGLLELQNSHKQVTIINLKTFYQERRNGDCFKGYKMDDLCIKSLISFIKKRIESVND